MKIITKNAIRCKKCGDIIESTSRHDFKWCSCKAVAVDGGHDYLKRTGNLGDWEDMSETKEVPGYYVEYQILDMDFAFWTDKDIGTIKKQYHDVPLKITDEDGVVKFIRN